MSSDPFLGLKTVALIQALVGGLSLVNGIIDVRSYPIPGGWAMAAGALLLVAGFETWRMRAGGWKVVMGAVTLGVVGWATLAYLSFDVIVAAAGVSGPQAEVIRRALSDRLQLYAIVWLIVAVSVFPDRHRFTK